MLPFFCHWKREAGGAATGSTEGSFEKMAMPYTFGVEDT